MASQKFRLIGLGGSARYCEWCGNDFEKKPGGAVVTKDEMDEEYVCSSHVPPHVKLGELFEPLNPPMTKERAAEIIQLLHTVSREIRNNADIDLFCHFVDALNIQDTREFAEMCGFPIATNVRVVSGPPAHN